jgi:hypothetical protein
MSGGSVSPLILRLIPERVALVEGLISSHIMVPYPLLASLVCRFLWMIDRSALATGGCTWLRNTELPMINYSGAFHVPTEDLTTAEKKALVNARHLRPDLSVARQVRDEAYDAQDTLHSIVDITSAAQTLSDCVAPRVRLTFYKNGDMVLGGSLQVPACFLADKPNLFVFSTMDTQEDCCELYGAELLI